MPTEKETQDAVMEYLRLCGCLPIRINSGSMFGEHKGKRWRVKFNSEDGCSDILCVMPDGRFAAFEVKRDGWKLAKSGERAKHEEKQREFLQRVRQNGGIAYVVTSIDVVRRVMREHGYEVV